MVSGTWRPLPESLRLVGWLRVVARKRCLTQFVPGIIIPFDGKDWEQGAELDTNCCRRRLLKEL
jgi:hypothetical protein